MKKLVSIVLTITLLLTTTVDAHHCKKHRPGFFGTTFGGTWQVIKIGTGVVLMCGGVVVGVKPCIPKNDECGPCCTCCSFVVSLPLIFAGGYAVKSGLHGLKKIIWGKKCKKCMHGEKHCPSPIVIINQPPQHETVVIQESAPSTPMQAESI